MLVTDVRPTPLMLEKAWDWNKDGAGAAWRESSMDDKGKEVTEVVWEKDLKLNQLIQLNGELPFPYVLHFRIASINGGSIRPSLCHPFGISNRASAELKGRTKGYVLFHNGNWPDWEKEGRYAAIQSGTPIPPGRWSDSRAIAWLCSIYGLGFMEFLSNQKGVAFGPHDYDIYPGCGWVKVNDAGHGDVWCSNDVFWNRRVYDNMKICKFGTCNRHDVNPDKLCPVHAAVMANDPSRDAWCKIISCQRKDNLNSEGFCPDHAHKGSPEVAKVTTPFAPCVQKIKLDAPTVEQLFKEGKISRSLLKSLRKAFVRIEYGGKDAIKAERALQLALRLPIFSGLVR